MGLPEPPKAGELIFGATLGRGFCHQTLVIKRDSILPELLCGNSAHQHDIREFPRYEPANQTAKNGRFV